MHSGPRPCPLPNDPTLAGVAAAMRDGGYWAEIVDARWRLVYMTDDLRLGNGAMVDLAPVPLGLHTFSAEGHVIRERWPIGASIIHAARQAFSHIGAWVLADTPGGREELRRLVDPRLHDIVDSLRPAEGELACSGRFRGYGVTGRGSAMVFTAVRIHDQGGRLAGTLIIFKPEASTSVLATLAAQGDLEHLERMRRVARADRRPAAILFADQESSSLLARRLPTPSYFSLGRRMLRAADQSVVDAGGVVGRHVGDGVVAFFLAETAGSESSAARACIQAAAAIREAMVEVAARSRLAPEDLTLRFGLHWGATVYVGQIATSGRTEVTALGDEVNEAARIEACATGGLLLASKALVERLDPEDARSVGLDPGRVSYTALSDLPTATEKARRDAPAIAVVAL